MTLRIPQVAPASKLAAERRGAVLGRFCHVCATVFGPHLSRHVGKGINGRDHVASPCPHEGEAFREGDTWWEPGVEVLSLPPLVGAPSAQVAPAGNPPK